MKWILLGPTTDFNINANRTLPVERQIKSTAEFVSQNIKTSRQIQYHIEISGKALYSKIRTTARFYCNYMDLFEVILLFIRTSREQSWEIHLQSLNLLFPYCFACDILNYARMTPVYLEQIYELKEKDEKILAVLDAGGFSVNKSVIPFTAIGSDHGNEQANRALNVIGRIKGIANSKVTFNEYFLTAAEMRSIVNNF